MSPKPLPPLGDLEQRARLEGNLDAQTAYERILPLQNEYLDDNLVQVRLLGWMLVFAPCRAGRYYVAASINDCVDNQAILDLGDYHLKYFVNCFISTTTRSSATPSTHPSRQSVESLRQAIKEGLRAPPKNHTEAKTQALVRDGYRCVATKYVDSTSYTRNSWIRDMFPDADIPGVKATQCAHILPRHINRGVDKPETRENSSNVVTVLSHFGGLIPSELNGDRIHDLGNILTLEASVHIAFDSLQIWFEPVQNMPHHYTVQKLYPAMHPELPPQIEFTTTNPQLPLPDPRYLAIHAACANALHMSGAAEVIDRILDDQEHTDVLATDGSSSELLEYLLFGAEIMVR